MAWASLTWASVATDTPVGLVRSQKSRLSASHLMSHKDRGGALGVDRDRHCLNVGAPTKRHALGTRKQAGALDAMIRKEAEHTKTLRSLKPGLFVQQGGFAGMRNFPREILGWGFSQAQLGGSGSQGGYLADAQAISTNAMVLPLPPQPNPPTGSRAPRRRFEPGRDRTTRSWWPPAPQPTGSLPAWCPGKRG